jgi:hypothetical protein
MNALYADRHGTVLDPLNGLPDLQARRVRFVGDAETRIREDYLRILRFFRFHAAYGDPDRALTPKAWPPAPRFPPGWRRFPANASAPKCASCSPPATRRQPSPPWRTPASCGIVLSGADPGPLPPSSTLTQPIPPAGSVALQCLAVRMRIPPSASPGPRRAIWPPFGLQSARLKPPPRWAGGWVRRLPPTPLARAATLGNPSPRRLAGRHCPGRRHTVSSHRSRPHARPARRGAGRAAEGAGGPLACLGPHPQRDELLKGA